MNLPLSEVSKKDLKLFYFISRPMPLEVKNEGVVTSVGFDLETAIAKALQKGPSGYSIKFVGSQLVKDIVDIVSLSEKKVDQNPPSPQEKVKKINFVQFKNNLLLVVDDFVEKKEDQIVLKRIIKELENKQ